MDSDKLDLFIDAGLSSYEKYIKPAPRNQKFDPRYTRNWPYIISLLLSLSPEQMRHLKSV